DVSIANFPELMIGDEIIKNAPLAVGDIWPIGSGFAGVVIGVDFLKKYQLYAGLRRVDYIRSFPEIVLGADFLRSHRLYISRRQSRVYFSYVGGAPFADIYVRLGAAAPSAQPPAPKP